MNNPTNAGKYDVRPMRLKNNRYKKVLAALGLAFLLGGIGIPFAIEQFHIWKRSVVLELIRQEIYSLPIDPNNKDPRQVVLKLAQCEGQLDDFAQRLATIGAAVDLGD